MILGLVVVAVLAQDAIEAEAKFRSILERAEKAGLTVPDLPAAVAELDALSLTPNLPPDLRHRFEVVRAQSRILSSLHAVLVKQKGGLFDLAIGDAPSISVKIVDVHRRGVKIFRAEATQDVAFAELSPEWVLIAAGRPDSSLETGLWLAKAARWESAFLAFGSSDTDHPLAIEARKRGVEAASSNLVSLIKGRKWTEAIARLDALDPLAPGDERLKTARAKLLDAMVEHGKELCRKGSKGPMKDVIDLIAKHFPAGAERIEDIREANRWIKVTDPKKFKKLDTAKGPPWLLESPEEGGHTLWSADGAGSYAGISIRVRFEKNADKPHGGLVWEDGSRHAWISSKSKHACVGVGKPGEYVQAYNYVDLSAGASHTLTVRVRGGHYLAHYNGVEFDRADTRLTSLQQFGINCAYGKVWIEEVLLLKME